MAYQSFAAAKNGSCHANASDKASFWAGFFACVSNPKAIVFFVALFPAFISPEHSILLQSVVCLGLSGVGVAMVVKGFRELPRT